MKSLFSILGLLILTSCTTTNQGSGNPGGGDGGTQKALLRGFGNFDINNDVRTLVNSPVSGLTGFTKFRIPAIMQTKSGRLIAMFDARGTSQADSANDIDTAMLTSDDNGVNWSVGSIVNKFDDFAIEDVTSQGIKRDSASFIDSAPVQTDNGDIIALSTVFSAGSGIQFGTRHPSATPFIYKSDGRKFLRLVSITDAAYPGTTGNNNTNPPDDPTKYLYEAPVEGGPITKIDDGSDSGYTIDKSWFIYTNGQPVKIAQQATSSGRQINAHVSYANAPFRNVRVSYIYMNRSTDNGATWGVPFDITQQFRPVSDNQHYIVSPGVGHVVKEGPNAGRIVYVLYETPGNASAPSNPNTGSGCNAFSIYSDDNGTTWTKGGYTKPAPGSNRASESQIIEAPGGQLLMYSRGFSFISLSHSVDGGKTWTDAVATPLLNGQRGGTQFGIQALNNTTGANGERLAVLIHPNNSSSRRDGTVRTGEFKKSGQKIPGSNEDEWVVDWNTTSSVYAYELAIAASADAFQYSSITELQDGNLAIFFEGKNSGQVGASALEFAIVKLDRQPL